MKNRTVIFLAIVIVILMAGCSQVDPKSEYYRGVYDGCVELSSKAGGTSFGIMASCNKFATDAEKRDWYSQSSKGWP